MTPQEAVREVQNAFPIPDYFEPDMATHMTVAEIISRYLPHGGRIFDFGSGACDKAAIATALGHECVAVDDLADNWYRRPGVTGSIERFARSRSVKFNRTYSPPQAEAFDMMMMTDVIAHLHDSPRDLLNELVTGLKIGGHLFITVPNLANIRKRIDLLCGRTNLAAYDLYWSYEGPWRGPVREYVRGDLEAMCGHLRLEIIELRTVHHMLANLPRWSMPVYKALTALFPGWRDTWLLVGRKPSGWTERVAPKLSEPHNLLHHCERVTPRKTRAPRR